MTARATLRAGGLLVCTVLFVIALVGAPSVGAQTRITEPTSSPFHVVLDAAGKPMPVTVIATGFGPYRPAFIEQCDGRAPSEPNWSPSLDCDIGTAASAMLVDKGGAARFMASDPNHRFVPVLGESPSTLFNCVAPGTPAPKNGLTNYTTCQIRVSSNNVQTTSDQVFLPIVFGSDAATHTTKSSSSVVWIIIGVVVAVVVVLGAVLLLRRRRPTAARAR